MQRICAHERSGRESLEAGAGCETDHIRKNCGVALNKTEGILIWRKKYIEYYQEKPVSEESRPAREICRDT